MNRDKFVGLFVGLVMGSFAGAGMGFALAARQDDMPLAQTKYEGFKPGIEFACGFAEQSAQCSKNANIALSFNKNFWRGAGSGRPSLGPRRRALGHISNVRKSA